MNPNSVKFFNFLNIFMNKLSSHSNWKSSKNFDTKIFEELNNNFLSLLTFNKENLVPSKSFFTFDQQCPPEAYRPIDQDFNKNYEFVFSGCSQTHGDHISKPLVSEGNYENIWGFQIANKYNKEALNLGMGGWSAQSILKGIMHHFQKNGHPKVLLVLYPDFGRVTAVDSDKTKMQKELNQHEIVQHWFLAHTDDVSFQKISKAPHSAVDVIPWTFALYHNLQAILLLDYYCKQNNIYFKYSSWDYHANIILKLLKNNFIEYSNYCEPETLDFLEETFVNKTCHNEIKDMYLKNVWNSGIDKQHIGIHQHTHIAEMFLRELENDNPWY